MNKDITASLMVLRDLLKQQAAEVLKPAEEELRVAKQNYHDAKILHNQLMKRSQKVQSLITLEMQAEHDKSVEADDAWEYHTPSELKCDMETDDKLIDLIKKIN